MEIAVPTRSVVLGTAAHFPNQTPTQQFDLLNRRNPVRSLTDTDQNSPYQILCVEPA
jgi:hypothetical protein